MYILINALGIIDSGGITVLKKCLDEIRNTSFQCIVYSNQSPLMDSIISQYKKNNKIKFITFEKKSLLHRLWIENWTFRKIILLHNIQLIYNFSGTAQFFTPVPQLIKLQNLMFYSKILDKIYWKRGQFKLWIQQILFKRLIFLLMYRNKKYFEIQSPHVQKNFLDFSNGQDKIFYLKSDIDVKDSCFFFPKHYDFTKKISFLYIVGPHFEAVHKNFKDFVIAMTILKEQNYDFEIFITLSKEQLKNSIIWNKILNDTTQFLGYTSQKEIERLFRNNTILISTSIIETLGLHVIEAIKNGILTIVPDEPYAQSVYGKHPKRYQLNSPKSLVNTIIDMITMTNNQSEKSILAAQQELKMKENMKLQSISDVVDNILKDTCVY